ncbi:glycosyltransferase family 9 protein [Bordetella genomosp. 9]|uniref:LPS biosynthesis glycosyltransferase n=1 Tax=Bordetella genomosp. 9 TaxID=1416803 RepID=A0A1W6YWH1_9BORD|nr:glycosyltransferase family 9 protein [Bordetella genomosp. 9]ARP85455.1 hypothetical protein CAL13_03915 [Bordetella genomosp. 9]
MNAPAQWTRPLEPRMTPARVAVFRALNLGDMLCAVPALRALRAGLPRAEISLVGLPWARAFQARYAAYVDRFIEFPGYPGLPEATARPDELDVFFAGMRKQHFDLCLQMHGSGPTSNRVVAQFGAHRAVGLGSPDDAASVRIWPYPSDRHEVLRNLYLVEQCLGVDGRDDALEFPLTAQDWAELRTHSDLMACLDTPYVCLQPGARDPAKRWPAADFARVGDALGERGWRVVLTGCGAERALAETVAARMRHPCLIAARDISVGGLAALLSGASLLVSNDTGVAHLAAALRVPSVVIFFATDPMRWGPPMNGPHRVAGGNCMPPADTVCAAAIGLLERVRSPVS